MIFDPCSFDIFDVRFWTIPKPLKHEKLMMTTSAAVASLWWIYFRVWITKFASLLSMLFMLNMYDQVFAFWADPTVFTRQVHNLADFLTSFYLKNGALVESRKDLTGDINDAHVCRDL